jgi:protein TonB
MASALTVPVSMYAPRPRPTRGGTGVSAASLSIGVHAAAIVAICAVLEPRLPTASRGPASFSLVFDAPSQPAQEKALAGRSLAPATERPVSAPLSAPRSMALRAAATPDTHPADRLRAPGAPAAAPPDAQAYSASPARAAPPPQQAAPDEARALAGLEAQVRLAVQNAAIYPQAARTMHRQGRARIRFDYLDGLAGTPALIASSQSSLLDAAALLAVRRASLPRAPAAIGPRKLAMLVWVNFGLVPED